MDYCSLHNHTSFSLMDSIIRPKDLFQKTSELGQSAIAITDHGTLAGMWDGLKYSKQFNIKFIAGCEFYFVENLDNEDERIRHIILLARNHQGYKNLLKLNKLANDNNIILFKKVIPRINWELLKDHSEGLICTTACGSGILSRYINTRRTELAKQEAIKLKDIFGQYLALEIQPHALKRNASKYNDYEDQMLVNHTLIKFGKELDIKIIAATNAHYLTQDQWEAHDTWLSIGTHMPVSAVSRLKYPVNEFYVKSRDEVEKFFSRLYKNASEFCDNTLYFADMCETPEWIYPAYPAKTGCELPTFPVKDQLDYLEFKNWLNNQDEVIKSKPEDQSYLRYWCENGLKERIPQEKWPEYKERLEEEFDVIEKLGFSSYMLIVADYINYCRINNIAVGCGRGSGGGSLIVYLINIFDADPIKYGLIFARFLNIYKGELPDLDCDVCSEHREKVFSYLRNKYGEDKVCHISNINTMTPKVFARDIARAFQFGGDQKTAVSIGTDIADSIPKEIKTLSEALENAPLFSEYAEAKDYLPLLKFAKTLDKLPKVWSTHAGGIIIGKRPLVECAPIRRDKDGNIVLEYEKERAQENGLIKMDILGVSALDIVVETLKLIKQTGKIPPLKEMIDYDANDSLTYDMMCKGDTFGVFQFGASSGMIDLCRKIKPRNIEDLAIINSIARPSAAGFRKNYVEARNGGEKIESLHPLMDKIFASTNGFPIFEEGLMFVAKDIAGWDMHDADRLRKLTKEKGKYPEKVKQWRTDFIDGAVKNKCIAKTIATEIWDKFISKFSGYGFNKCLYHSQLVDIYSENGIFYKTIPISKMQAGSYIKSRDELTGKKILVKILKKHNNKKQPLIEIELNSGEKIKCTITHKFRVKEDGYIYPLWKIIQKNLTIVVEYAENNLNQKNYLTKTDKNAKKNIKTK